MAKKYEPIKIPTQARTDSRYYGLMSYPEHDAAWEIGEAFGGILVFDGFERGRSAAHAIWRDVSTGKRYPMFLTFLEDVIKNKGGISHTGEIAGVFGFAKRGMNYSIMMIEAC